MNGIRQAGVEQFPLQELDMIGAIKVKDGFFIGDEFAAQVPRAPPGYVLPRTSSSSLRTK